MSAAKKNKVTAIVALLGAAGAIGFLAFSSMEESLVYYWTPSDLTAKGDTVKGATIRLGGMVENGSMHWDAESLTLRFSMSEQPEPGGTTITVVSTGSPPQMFREGIGCIVEGKYDGKIFHSDRLMVKHSNEYQPPEHGDEAKEKYKTLVVNPG